jgi:hypothetical protein
MSLVDHETNNKVPYLVNETYNALKKCVNRLDGFSIEKCDDLLKTIYLKTGVSLFSWGESISINVKETVDGMSEVTIISSPKTGMMFGGAMDMGKNQKNINIIMSYLSEELQKYNQVNPAKNSDSNNISNKLKQLLKLKEESLITEEEYEVKKQKLLDQL